jgi:hypothetical protein
MGNVGGSHVDFIEELKMRRWARENYVPGHERQKGWHAVVHDEMRCKDSEAGSADRAYTVTRN